MYAIIATGGKQYKVAEGDVIDIEKLPAQAGDSVDFDVIFLADGDKIVTDADKLAKAHCAGEVLDQFKGEKQLVFKFKKRKRYRKLNGHRQNLTKVKITELAATAGSAKKSAAKSETAAAAKDEKAPTAEKKPAVEKTATDESAE